MIHFHTYLHQISSVKTKILLMVLFFFNLQKFPNFFDIRQQIVKEVDHKANEKMKELAKKQKPTGNIL